MQNFEFSLMEFFLAAYVVGIPVNAIVTLFVGYKAGDLKRKYWKTILSYCLLSWAGIINLAFTAWKWIEDKKQREKRFPR